MRERAAGEPLGRDGLANGWQRSHFRGSVEPGPGRIGFMLAMLERMSSCLLVGGLVLFCLACGSEGVEDSTEDGGTIPGQDGWDVLPDVSGGRIQEIAVAELAGKIYIAGGFRMTAAVADVRAYDVAAGKWGQVASLPEPVHHANLAASSGKLYVLGSLVGLGFTAIGTSWVYDPAANRWTEVATMVAGDERGSAAVGVIDGKVYLAGGYRNGVAVADVSVYDPANDQWDTTLPNLPAPRDHLTGAAIDGVFYVIGGRSGTISSVSGDVYAFDPAQPALGWVARASMPTPRGGTASGVVDGKIVVVGGEGNPAASSGVFPQVESYDPVKDQWTKLSAMRTPRHGMGAAGYDGKLYVPGGATSAGFGAVATFEVFTPAPQ